MDRGAWWATVHGVTKGGTRLSDQATAAKRSLPWASLQLRNESPAQTLIQEAQRLHALCVVAAVAPVSRKVGTSYLPGPRKKGSRGHHPHSTPSGPGVSTTLGWGALTSM